MAPKSIPLHIAQGLLREARQYMAEGRFYKAYHSYKRLLDSDRGAPELLLEACQPLIRANATAEVEALAEEGVKRFPDSAGVWNQLGLARHNVGRPEAALDAFRQALELDPTYVHAWVGVSQVHERLHDLPAALDAIGQATRLAPQVYFFRYCRGAILRRMKRLDDAFADQQHVLSEAAAKDANVRHMAWCEVSKIESARGEIAAAQDALRHAKDAQAPLREPFIPQFQAYQIAQAKRIDGLDAETARQWHGHPLAPTQRGPGRQAFLVGHPRSGTTLTEQMLAAHPSVITLDEREAYTHVESTLLGLAPSVQDFRNATSAQARKFEQAYLQEAERYLGEAVGDRLLVDKRPDSVLMLSSILRFMPRARVIVVIRDPRDVCTSCYEQAFPAGIISSQFHSIASTCRYYAWFMGFWLKLKEVLPRTMWHEVRYETLVTDTEASARRLIEHVGLPWDPAVLDFRKKASERLVSTPSYEAVTKPVSSGSVGRWRAYAKEFEQHGAPLLPFLDAFGYEH